MATGRERKGTWAVPLTIGIDDSFSLEVDDSGFHDLLLERPGGASHPVAFIGV